MLLRIVFFATFCFSAFNVMRLITSLDALHYGATTGEVGVLMALITLIPVFLSMRCGRWIDEIGFRIPLILSSSLLLAAGIIPSVFPTSSFGLIPLAASCVLNGSGNMIFSIVSLYLVGAIAPTEKRTAYFSWYSLSWSLSGLLPPVMAGYIIDFWGHRWAFALMALFALLGLTVILSSLKHFKSVTLPKRPKRSGSSLHLLFDPLLGRVLLVSTFVSVGWDLQIFMFPIYGHYVGLSAAEVGWLVGSFYTATLIVRFALPFVSRHVTEWLCLAVALTVIAAAYAVFPLFDEFVPLLVVAFFIGLGLGASTPNIMSLTQSDAPPGRVGEALGIRTMLANGTHFVLPLAYGSILAAISVSVLFFISAGMMGFTAVLAYMSIGREGRKRAQTEAGRQ